MTSDILCFNEFRCTRVFEHGSWLATVRGSTPRQAQHTTCTRGRAPHTCTHTHTHIRLRVVWAVQRSTFLRTVHSCPHSCATRPSVSPAQSPTTPLCLTACSSSVRHICAAQAAHLAVRSAAPPAEHCRIWSERVTVLFVEDWTEALERWCRAVRLLVFMGDRGEHITLPLSRHHLEPSGR